VTFVVLGRPNSIDRLAASIPRSAARSACRPGFDNAPPVTIWIETRPEVGEGFNPLASLLKQFELIYVVEDEHDLVGSRAIRASREKLCGHDRQGRIKSKTRAIVFFAGALPCAVGSDEWDFFRFGAENAPEAESLIRGKMYQFGQVLYRSVSRD
jgi:hypothetical protein